MGLHDRSTYDDDDNEQEQRSTDTLSGGETVLTSLALALLELNQQMQRAELAVNLDNLFTDEGFGPLDTASAIESLRVAAGWWESSRRSRS